MLIAGVTAGIVGSFIVVFASNFSSILGPATLGGSVTSFLPRVLAGIIVPLIAIAFLRHRKKQKGKAQSAKRVSLTVISFDFHLSQQRTLKIALIQPKVPFIASTLSLKESIVSSKSRQESPFFSGLTREQRPCFKFMQFFRSQKWYSNNSPQIIERESLVVLVLSFSNY